MISLFDLCLNIAMAFINVCLNLHLCFNRHFTVSTDITIKVLNTQYAN